MNTRIKKSLLYALSFVAAVMFSACSDDDDGGDGTGEGLEDFKISFNVSGGDEGFKEGSAIIVLNEMSGNYTLNLGGNDAIGEEDEDAQTFSLIFYKGPRSEPIPIPDPGTYIVGTPQEAAAEDGFWVAYENSTTAPATNFGQAEVEGELIISDVTADYVEGTFYFSAGQVSGEETIVVENGVFKARRAQ
jgi:hypothetical protein